LIRLQCYEGLDEAKALYEWEYAKQLLYTQILKDKIGEVLTGSQTLEQAVDSITREDDVFFSDRFLLPRPLLRAILSDKVLTGSQTLEQAVDSITREDDVFFSDRFLLPRPLLRAILSDKPAVLLVDEVDKSDTEFEAFLLEVLSDFQVTVPEIGTLRAKHLPFVVLTSNNSREMSDALKRRCLHLYLDFPDPQRELEIIKLKVPGVGDRLAEEVVELLQRFRKLDLKKRPSISETLDWVKALTLLNAKKLDESLVEETLSTVMKYEGDIRRAQEEMKVYIAERKAKLQASRPERIESDKDLLH